MIQRRSEPGVALTLRDGQVWSVSTAILRLKRACDHAVPVTPRCHATVKVQDERNHLCSFWISSRDSDPSSCCARAVPHVCHGDNEAVVAQEAIDRSKTIS